MAVYTGKKMSFTIGDDEYRLEPEGKAYESKTAVSGGTDVSLVTTGEKFTWNQKLSSHQDISGKADLNSPAFTGTPTAPTAEAGTNTTQIATTAFVMNAFQANDAMIFKGTLGTEGTVESLPSKHTKGWTYKVITAGTYAGVACEPGDMVICVTNGNSSNDAHWNVIQTNIDGAVTGPASATGDHIVTFNGTSGKLIKDSGFTIATSVPENAVFTDTTYESKSASNGGTDLSLVTTGEKYAWNNKTNNTGTVTNVEAGLGLAGGPVTTSGSLKAKVRNETKLSNDSSAASEVTNRIYAVGVDKSGYLAVVVPWTDTVSSGLPSVTSTDNDKVLKVVNGSWEAAQAPTGLPSVTSSDDDKVLQVVDGEWTASDQIKNTKAYSASVTVTNTTGAYSHTFEDDNVTSDMKPVSFETARDYVFGAPVTVTPSDGEFTIACDDVSGTDTVVITFIKATADPTEVSSDEFDILNNRLTAVENTHVDTDVTIATTDWTLDSSVYKFEWENAMIVVNSLVEVFPQEGAESAGIEGFDYEKATGKVTITTDVMPTGSLPVTIRVINAKINHISEASGVSF